MPKPVLARDVMTGPVRQVTTDTPVRDAAAFLLRHGISGAPVIDEHGQWVGVFTQNDLARYVQERIGPGPKERSLEMREAVDAPGGFLPDRLGETPVRELLSVGLFTVFPDATLDEVVHTLTSFKVHRVFVIRPTGRDLVGVITSMDILRWMDANPASKKRGRQRANA